MKYDFDKVWDRVDTDSIKWDRQFKFGVPTGLIPFWIADTDFGTLPEAVTGASAVWLYVNRKTDQ